MYQQVNLEVLQRFDPLALSPLVEDQKFFYYFIKRGMDIILAILLLVLLSPLIALISTLIVVDSGWPVVFSQTRIGAKRWTRNGFSYWQYKTQSKAAVPKI